MIWLLFSPNWLRRLYLLREIKLLKKIPPQHLRSNFQQGPIFSPIYLIQWPNLVGSIAVLGLISAFQMETKFGILIGSLSIVTLCASAFVIFHFYVWSKETSKQLGTLDTIAIHLVLQKRLEELKKLQ